MSETLWTCDKCGAVMTTGSLAEHERWHKERDAADIEATRILPPSIPPEATMSETEARPCPRCGGFGEVPGPGGREVCHYCGGLGEVFVDIEGDEDE